MRSDAKIGMVIGAAIIALAGWYFLRDGGSDSRRASQLEPPPLWVPPDELAGEPSRADIAAEVPVEPDETHIALHIPPPVSHQEPDSAVATQPPATQPAAPSAIAQPEPEPEPPAETRPPEPAFRTHVVQPGDNFAKLAKRYYDSQATRYVELLMRTNPDVEPRRMRVGSRIVIPPIKPAGAEPAKSLRPPQPVLPEMYRVKKGDTFHDIAKRLCGDGRRWPELYRLNKGVVGADPGRLRAGQILQLPTDWPRTRQ